MCSADLANSPATGRLFSMKQYRVAEKSEDDNGPGLSNRTYGFKMTNHSLSAERNLDLSFHKGEYFLSHLKCFDDN